MKKYGVQMFGMRNPAPDREAKAAFAEARKMYQGEGEKPLVPVDMFFSAKAGEEMTLTCRDRDGNECTSRSPAALSGKKASSKAEIRMLLKRTDKTVFYAELCQVDMDEGLATHKKMQTMEMDVLAAMTGLRLD